MYVVPPVESICTCNAYTLLHVMYLYYRGMDVCTIPRAPPDLGGGSGVTGSGPQDGWSDPRWRIWGDPDLGVSDLGYPDDTNMEYP